VLGMRTGTTFVYFSLGAAIWRFLALWLLVIVALIALVIGLAIAIGIIVAIGGIVLGQFLHGGPAEIVGALAAVLFILIFYGAIIYLTVRLTFFIPPVVVAEKQIDLARVWQLSHGNFWRIFAVGLAIYIPLLLVMGAVMAAIYGPVLFQFPNLIMLAMHNAPEATVQAQTQAWSEALQARGLAMWPYNAAFELLFGTISYGLTYSASAFAYREILPSPAPSLRA
jgi:hypothetical protein